MADAIPWTLVGTDEAYRAFLRIESRRYELPDGHETRWDILAGARTVAVVALTGSGDVVLARQFRPGPGLVLDELPGGMVDEDEDIATAAARELLEETGYSAARVEVVGRTWLAGFSTIQRHAAVAHGCVRVGLPAAGGDELVEPVVRTMAQFVAQVRRGELTDADAALMCLDHLGAL